MITNPFTGETLNDCGTGSGGFKKGNNCAHSNSGPHAADGRNPKAHKMENLIKKVKEKWKNFTGSKPSSNPEDEYFEVYAALEAQGQRAFDTTMAKGVAMGLNTATATHWATKAALITQEKIKKKYPHLDFSEDFPDPSETEFGPITDESLGPLS